MISRPVAVLILATLSACADARAPSDVSACATETACVKLYREALLRFQNCRIGLGNAQPAPGLASECDTLEAELNSLANAVARFHAPKTDPGEGDHGFDVPALPPAKTP